MDVFSVLYLYASPNFSSWWLIPTVFETEQISQKIMTLLQVEAGEDLSRPEMVSLTLEEVTRGGVGSGVTAREMVQNMGQ